MISSAIALALVIAGGVAFAVFSKRQQGNLPSDKPLPVSDVSAPAPAQKLTAADVAKMDKDATFWGYFKNASMQQKTISTHIDTDEAGLVTYRKYGFDFQTKHLQAAIDEPDSGSSERTKTRCYDGKVYFKSVGSDAEWTDVTKPGETEPNCDLNHIPASEITDGTNTGGLTEAQANTFVNFLRGKKGLSNIRSLKLETHRGKQYLHYTVDFVPIPIYGSYGGNVWFGTAFQSTGLSKDKWPYDKWGTFGGGTHLEYYVDPATSLPTYSKTTALPMKDKSGKDLPLDNHAVMETVYQFGTATFDVQTSNNADLTLDWQ